MIRKWYKCTLLSDIVLNASLNTEGNMDTLDYIPGSNFLGIVAGKLYVSNNKDVYRLIHEGDVKFGDAHIAANEEKHYAMPFSFMQDKLKNSIVEHEVYIDYLIDHREGIIDGEGKKRQLKQKRTGYVSSNGSYMEKVEKTFALKSKHNRAERRSEEGKMFGFESIIKGQHFIFHIDYKDEQDVTLIETYLKGNKHIGKSKSAEYGKVTIECIPDQKLESAEIRDQVTIVYAESNLCFYDKNTGQPTFKPDALQLGLEGEINWSKSQIRTYSYSPWNSTRGVASSQRNVLLKGSVFYVETESTPSSIDAWVGEYNNEGLGKVLYNPSILAHKDENKSALKFKKAEVDNINIKPINPASHLAQYLSLKKNEEEDGKAMIISINSILQNDNYWKIFSPITSSQWGGIREIASNSNFEETVSRLFSGNGYLRNGIAYQKYWSKNEEKPIATLCDLITNHANNNSIFIAKLAAEFAKKKINEDIAKSNKKEKS